MQGLSLRSFFRLTNRTYTTMKTPILLIVLFISTFGFSQNFIQTQRQVAPKPTNQELYGLEYEIKHYAFGNGDSTILNEINFELLPIQREQSVDVEVYDASIDQIIVLYSYDKIHAKYIEKWGGN